MSFDDVVSACLAAIDRRPKTIVMICLLFSYVKSHKADKTYAQLIKDRVSQLRDNETHSIASFTQKSDNLIDMNGAREPDDVEAYNLMKVAMKLSHPDFCDRITLQTYQKLTMFRPKEYMNMIRAPVMIIIPKLDDILPSEEQREAFARIQSPKREYWAVGKRHLNIVTGENSKEMMAATTKFFKKALENTIE